MKLSKRITILRPARVYFASSPNNPIGWCQRFPGCALWSVKAGWSPICASKCFQNLSFSASSTLILFLASHVGWLRIWWNRYSTQIRSKQITQPRKHHRPRYVRYTSEKCIVRILQGQTPQHKITRQQSSTPKAREEVSSGLSWLLFSVEGHPGLCRESQPCTNPQLGQV